MVTITACILELVELAFVGHVTVGAHVSVGARASVGAHV